MLMAEVMRHVSLKKFIGGCGAGLLVLVGGGLIVGQDVAEKPNVPPLIKTPLDLPKPRPQPKSSVEVAGVGDSYFPYQGNPGYDAQHYTLEINANSAKLRQFSGTTTMEAVSSQDLSLFHLDFIGFEISQVMVDGVKANFERDEQELIITPSKPIQAGAKFKVSVSYAGESIPYLDPSMVVYQLTSGWREWGEGNIAAFSQPDGAMAWFPSNNTPRDKATYTFRITVDAPKMGLASGLLKEVIPVDQDTKTYVWEMRQPMSTQVVSVMIGEFELHESQTPAGVPIRNYFPPGVAPETIASYERTNVMLDFLASVFGPYPYEAYGVVAVPGWLEGSGYETQSLTTVSADDKESAVGVHEMGHQWFGNAITVSDWKDVWLHEGFARYIQLLWAEKTIGVEEYNKKLQQQVDFQYWYAECLPAQLSQPPLPEGHVIPAVNQGVAYAYHTSYTAGALALHALRMEVGDEVFFKILPTFFQRFKDKPVSTADFIATAEELAGRKLTHVWDTWLFGTTIPKDFPRLKKAYTYK